MNCPGLAPAARAFDFPSHRLITETALTPLGFDQDSVYLVNQGNAAVDAFDESSSPEAHFDDETFRKGSRRLREKISAVLAALDDNDRELALDTLGRGLHTVQDFFSHSNFIENNGVETPIDLLDLEDPPADLACDRETFKGGLTSGYYPDKARPSEMKCVHAELNKDSAEKGERHRRAVEKATVETRHYVESVLEAVRTNVSWSEPRRAELLKLLLNRGRR